MASRILCLVALLVATLCVTANAGPVTPTLGTSKLAKIAPNLCFTLKLIFDTRGLAADEPVLVIFKDAVSGNAVLALVGGVVNPVKPLELCLSVADTLRFTIQVFGMEKDMELPLSALHPVVETLGGTVKVLIVLAKTIVNGVPVLALLDSVKGVVAIIPLSQLPLPGN